MKNSKRIYLDHSATTPVDPQVVEAMRPYWSERFGNSESAHAFGQRAAGGLTWARQTVADVLGCRLSEVVFTGSGTEADNLALRGAAWAARRSGMGNHLVISAIEHHAVGETAHQLRDLFGFEVTRVPVDGQGLVDPEAVADAIRPDTFLVSVMLANNEIGTVQPVAALGELCRRRGVLCHTDAIQASGRLPLHVEALSVDLLSLSAHKCYGPKGVGCLYVRKDVSLVPAITGGGHEQGYRPGTVNVAGAVGLAAALRLVEEERQEEVARLRVLRDRLIEGVLTRVPDSRLTGHPTERLAHHASFAFRGLEGEALVLALDLKGFAVSSGAACEEGDPEPSFVLSALGIPWEWGLGSLRVSLGHATDERDIDRFLDALPEAVAELRTGELGR